MVLAKNATTRAQASRERHTIRLSAGAGAHEGRQPVASAALVGRACAGARVPTPTARSRPPTARPPPNPRIAHIPTDQRHPAACATGSATSGGTAVLTDIATEYDAVTVPIRSGKYRFTSGGSSTLPIPRPPSAITDHRMNAGALPASARRSSPAVDSSSAEDHRRLEPEATGDGRGQRAEQGERRDGDGAEQADLRVGQREVLPHHLDDRRDGRHRDPQVETDEDDAGQHDDTAAPGRGVGMSGRHDENSGPGGCRRAESSAPGLACARPPVLTAVDTSMPRNGA